MNLEAIDLRATTTYRRKKMAVRTRESMMRKVRAQTIAVMTSARVVTFLVKPVCKLRRLKPLWNHKKNWAKHQWL